MTSHYPEGDRRSAYANSPVSAQAALAELATSAAADAARGRTVEIDDPSGFRHAYEDAPARERVQLGGPPWLFPAFLGVIAAIVLTCVGFYWFEGQRNKPDPAVFEQTTIALPAAAGGLTLGSGPGVQAAATRANEAMAGLELVDVAWGGYLDSGGGTAAFVAAGKRVTPPNQLVSTAETTKSRFVAGAGTTLAIEPIALKRTPPGPLGGVMRCGPTTVVGIDATYCVAVDEGSVVQVLIAGTDPAPATTARVLRSAVVRR